MPQLTVIGAGIAGLVAAALAHARGYAVTVVEAGATAGGLWKSSEVVLDGHKLWLDAGLRLPVATGNARLDGLIFHRPDFGFDWTMIDGWPRESAITAGHFNVENSCIDATRLGAELPQAISDMRAAQRGDGPGSALDHSLGHYGATLTGSLIRDAAFGLFGMELDDLEAQAVQWFIPRRMILGDPAATAALLGDERLSGRVAHAQHADLPAGMSRTFMRPSAGGISTWTTALQRSLQEDGVEFIFNDQVESAEFAAGGRAIRGLVLKSGRRIDVGHVMCTIAPSLLASVIGFQRGAQPPFRDLRISHVLVDRAAGHRSNYCLNFNRDARFFRAIFQHDAPAGVSVISFEHLVAHDDDRDHAADALGELIRAGGMPEGTRAIAASTERYPNSVPVPAIPYVRNAEKMHREMSTSIPNLLFAGRSAGGAPFLDMIITEIETAITSLEVELLHA